MSEEEHRQPDEALDEEPEDDGAAGNKKPLEGYHTIADTIGGVPNLRLWDNIIQGVVVFLGTALGCAIGYFWKGELQGLLIGLLIGLVGSVLVSGLVLMVLGWVRSARKLRK